MKQEILSLKESKHKICTNTCTDCDNHGKLNKDEICPICGGSGCRDKKYVPWIVEGGNKYLWCINCIFKHFLH